MKIQSEDRRVQRTQQALREALVSLIVERGYEGVTVQDILDRANVGRATFYAHYYDKEDLLLSGFDHLRAELDRQLQDVGTTVSLEQAVMPIGRVLFRHAKVYHHVYKAMVGKRSGSVFLAQLHAYVEAAVQRQLNAQTTAEELAHVPMGIVVQYVTGALLALLTWWLDADCPYTAEYMELRFIQMTAPAVAAVLRAGNGTIG